MTAITLLTGRLHGDPITRSTRNGGEVTFFKLKVASGNRVEFWSVATFSDTAREELAGLGEGDALSAVGEPHVDTYEWNGETRINLKLTADRLLALKPKPAKARDKLVTSTRASGRAVAASSWAAPSRKDNQTVEHRLRDAILPELNEALREGIGAPSAGGEYVDDADIPF